MSILFSLIVNNSEDISERKNMTATIEKIQKLMEELGPAHSDIDAIVQTEEPSWALQFSDETVVIIEPSEEPSRMILSTELGSATDSMELPIYETLLCYNFMWRETGGVKIGLAGPKGELIMSSELCLEDLILINLQEAIDNFVSIARSWRTYVTGNMQSAPALPNMESNNFHLQA